MRSHQEGRQQFTVEFVVELTSLLQLLLFMKIRNIPLLLLVVSRKSQSWDKRSWKGLLFTLFILGFYGERSHSSHKSSADTNILWQCVHSRNAQYILLCYFLRASTRSGRDEAVKSYWFPSFFFFDALILLRDFLYNLGKAGRMLLFKCPSIRLFKVRKES